jgi:hypothetical protein
MKKRIIIISICAVLVLGAVAAAVCWFACPGIRFSGNLANFNLKEAKCYIISDDKVIDQTTMTFEGLYKYSDGVINDWDYTFEIPGCTDIVDGGVVYDECFATKVDKRWTAQYYVYQDASGQDVHLLENQEPMVIVTMDFVKNHPVARVHFAEDCNRDGVWAVCADSEEEALELFRTFREQ